MIFRQGAVNADRISLSDLVDQERLWNRHIELGEIGRTGNGCVNRQALTAEDSIARQLVIDWGKQLGCCASMDEIGNLFLRFLGSNPELPAAMTGSHLDTQPSGGMFDGIYGVLAGLEVLEAFAESGLQPERSIDLVIWLNEEGCRFAPSTMGSGVYCGALNIDEILGVKDSDGVTVGESLAAMRNTLTEVVQREGYLPIFAYLEAHIEQGPILEDRAVSIGAVTSIQGMRQYQVSIRGQAAHAGTTPRARRQDALATAVKLISKIESSFDDPQDQVRFTVGRMVVWPNSPNTIAEAVVFTIDLRHPDERCLDTIERTIEACAALVSECAVTVQCLHRSPAIDFNQALVEATENSAENLGLSSLRLPSGATHDARSMAKLCPASMIFVPCRGGLSHNENEWVDAEHLAAGTRVLAEVIQSLTCGEYPELCSEVLTEKNNGRI